MKFIDEIKNYSWEQISKQISTCTASNVESVLSKQQLSINDFLALVSPAAEPYMEAMATLSRYHTLQRFGKTIQLYIPLYLSNACVNHCVYCGFNQSNSIQRIILNDDQILAEVHAIKALGGFEHVLLVTGESPSKVGIDYLEHAVELVKPYFSSISIEVQPLHEEGYKRLISKGVMAVYCYQETYNKEHYPLYHSRGIKADFDWRLDTFDRMGTAQIFKIGLGILIGLEDWRTDAAFMALHLQYLKKQYWRTRYSVSFPRIRPHEGIFQPNVVMTDKQLAQLIFAFRIFDHDIDIALSTREDKTFRDNMMTLGVTSLSAGSKTDPGGYTTNLKPELEQFMINDDRSPSQILQSIHDHHYEAVWKDWDQALLPT